MSIKEKIEAKKAALRNGSPDRASKIKAPTRISSPDLANKKKYSSSMLDLKVMPTKTKKEDEIAPVAVLITPEHTSRS